MHFIFNNKQVAHTFFKPVDSGAVQLKSDNLDMTLGKFINKTVT